VLKLLVLSSKSGKLANFHCLVPITIAWTSVLSHMPAASFHAAQISLQALLVRTHRRCQLNNSTSHASALHALGEMEKDA
jgi:hypothetical protein